MNPDPPRGPEQAPVDGPAAGRASNQPGALPTGEELWRLLQGTGDPLAPAEPTSQPDLPPSAGARPVAPPAGPSGPGGAPLRARPDEAISQLHRVLTDPVAAELDLKMAQPAAEMADFDSALLNYYRDAGYTVACRNHADRSSAAQCPECQAYYCQECLVVRYGRMLCRDCAIALYVPTEEAVLRAHELGLDSPEAQVEPEEQPEFQIGSAVLGLEGHPAHPLKRLVALLFDLAITRGLLLLVVALLGIAFGHFDSPVFHLYDQTPTDPALPRVINALLLLKPLQPWLIIFAVFDFLYFFSALAFFNRTVGMSWTGCRLVTEWGEFVPFGAVALRTLVFMVFLGWPAILIAWFFPAFRGPHDYAAGTVVINYAGVKRIDAYEAVQIKL